MLQLLERRRRSERVHANDLPRGAHVALPAESRRLLYCNARRHMRWQHTVPVLLRLVLEDVTRRHRDYARADALREQLLVGLYDQTDFAARGDEEYLGVAAGGVGEHVGAACDSR